MQESAIKIVDRVTAVLRLRSSAGDGGVGAMAPAGFVDRFRTPLDGP